MPENEREYTRTSFLLVKYLKGTCSSLEAQEIVAFLENPSNDDVLTDMVASQWHALNSEQKDDFNPVENKLIMEQILDRLHHRIRLSEEQISNPRFLNNQFIALFTKVAAILILPLLVYAIYLTSRTAKTIETKQVVWQTVKTPVGMQTDFLLPDSTHVWLNSGSEIKYPSPFAQDKRQVELTGEAFFDVVKDAAHPFLVKAGKMNIEVKGTKFNVINYPGETLTELVLQSGSVRLFSGNYGDNITVTYIKPGECALLDIKQNKLSVRKVDVVKYIAWKDGELIFKDDQMDEVVRKLNRWFNVDIILRNPELKEYVYTATFRDETLPQILELLKISAPIKYRITARERLNDNSYSKRKIVITRII
jgi:transmembrane sensor